MQFYRSDIGDDSISWYMDKNDVSQDERWLGDDL